MSVASPTHEVLNQAPPLVGHNVFEVDPALVEGLTSATLLDLIERPVEGEARLDNNTLRVPVRANSFVTVRLAPA